MLVQALTASEELCGPSFTQKTWINMCMFLTPFHNAIVHTWRYYQDVNWLIDYGEIRNRVSFGQVPIYKCLTALEISISNFIWVSIPSNNSYEVRSKFVKILKKKKKKLMPFFSSSHVLMMYFFLSRNVWYAWSKVLCFD